MKEKKQLATELSQLITERESHDFEKQITEAARIIGEIGAIGSDQAFLRVKNRLKLIQPDRSWLHYLIRIAASLFIPLLLVTGWLVYRQANPEEQYCEQRVSNPPGIRSQLALPDGSSVWLGGESSIRFSLPFNKQNREIFLQGEAYFDVMKNKAIPFVVHADILSVTVTGTCFNVKAFEEDQTAEVVLEEGSIILQNHRMTGANKAIVMKPGERTTLDKSTGETVIERVKTENFTSWHNGKLIFDETPMPEVALQLERWYGVRVTIRDPEINKYRITTTFENEPLDQVLELLRLSSPIDIRYLPVTLNKSIPGKTRPEIIISIKSE